MAKFVYNPELVGKKIVSSRGNKVILRKYHMTEEDIITLKQRFEDQIIGVSARVKKLASRKFFNPYRRGIYYSQIQALYLLGANKWHSFPQIKKTMQKFMLSYTITKKINGAKITMTGWQNFISRTPRRIVRRSKDENGKIQENMIFLQRLSEQHPSGLKLCQVGAAIDIKRVSKPGLPNGIFYYRLSTYPNSNKALPIRDFSQYNGDCRKYMSSKFRGITITKDKIIKNGVIRCRKKKTTKI